MDGTEISKTLNDRAFVLIVKKYMMVTLELNSEIDITFISFYYIHLNNDDDDYGGNTPNDLTDNPHNSKQWWWYVFN
jgi:hypothetical protein